MNDIKLAVYQALIGNGDIISKLAINNHAVDPDIQPSQENSVVDYLDAPKMVAPFITVRSDDISLAGQFELTNAFLLVRCYNERDKTFYTINEVASSVRKLLNGLTFPVAGYALVETRWEATTAELLDPGLDMNYRELRFLIQLT